MAEEIIPIETGTNRIKPVGMLEAVSEIQRYSVAETGGSKIPADYFTLDMQMEYFMLGLKSVLHGGIFTVLLMPVLIGVLEDKIHIFGHSQRTFLDNVYMFLMTLMFAMAYAFFYAYASTFNAGNVTKKMLLNIYGGVTMGSVIKALLSVFVYHIMFFYVLTENNVYRILDKMNFLKADLRTDLFYFIKDTKPVLISSSAWVFLTSSAYIAVCWLAFYISENRKKSKEKPYGNR